MNRPLKAFLACLLALGLGGCALSPEPEPREKAEKDDKPAVSEQTRATFQAAIEDLEAERYQEAVERLKPLTGHQPPLPGALLNLGIAYRHLARYEDAEQAVRAAIDHRPEWPAAHVELGIVLRHMGRFEKAREAYEQALSLDEGHATAHLNLGVLCDLYLRQLQCAVDHYQRYQTLTAEEDERVKLWIADLNRRMEDQ